MVIDYWCEAFRHLGGTNTIVEVRYDPDNRHIAYARVKGVWRKCISSFSTELNGKSYRELKLASQKLRQRNKNSRKRKEMSEENLALFLLKLEKDEEMLELRRKQAQMKIGKSGEENAESFLDESSLKTNRFETDFIEFIDDSDYSHIEPPEVLK